MGIAQTKRVTVQESDAVEIIVDDIVYEFTKQYPDLKVIYLPKKLQISVDKFTCLNNFEKRIAFLKMIFLGVNLDEIERDTIIKINFYNEKLRKTKYSLKLFPEILKVDEYRQLGEILQIH